MKFDYTPPWEAWTGSATAPVVVDIEGVDSQDHMLQIISAERTFYEVELLEHLFIRGPRGGVYVDVGAHIGNHSIYFRRFLADAVVAVEPSPIVGPLLRRNLQVNGLSDVVVFDCAIAAEGGYARHYQPSSFPQNTGAARVVPLDSPIETPKGALVRTATLDSLLGQIEATFPGMQISLIKLDVEGMELDCLLGASRLLHKHRPQLVVELATREAKERVSALLNSLGYHASGCFCATPTYHFIDMRVHQLRTTPPRWIARVGNSWQRGRLRTFRVRLRGTMKSAFGVR